MSTAGLVGLLLTCLNCTINGFDNSFHGLFNAIFAWNGHAYLLALQRRWQKVPPSAFCLFQVRDLPRFQPRFHIEIKPAKVALEILPGFGPQKLQLLREQVPLLGELLERIIDDGRKFFG